jgi:hypothetical protein
MADDRIQHGIDDANNDAEKGATLGGLGGAAVGAAAGAVAGPAGAIIGAVVGGLAGAGASGLAVGAVDRVDDDNTITGVGGSTLSSHDIVGSAPAGRSDLADSSSNAVFGTTGSTETSAADVSDMNIDRGTAGIPNVSRDTNIGSGGGTLGTGGAASSGLGAGTSLGTDAGARSTGGIDTNIGGHNVVTGDAATTDAGNTGLGTGAVIGGVVGTAVGGPVGAVVGGTLGSVAGGVAGDATEAAEEGRLGTGTSSHDQAQGRGI